MPSQPAANFKQKFVSIFPKKCSIQRSKTRLLGFGHIFLIIILLPWGDGATHVLTLLHKAKELERRDVLANDSSQDMLVFCKK